MTNSNPHPDTTELTMLRSMDSLFGSCGCGNPDLYWEVMLEALQACGRGEYYKGDKYGLFVRYILDRFELTEHGGSIYGAWLTKSGSKVLELLEKYGCDDDQWPSDWPYYELGESGKDKEIWEANL